MSILSYCVYTLRSSTLSLSVTHTHTHTHTHTCWLQSLCGASQTIRLFKQLDLQIEGRSLSLSLSLSLTHTHTRGEGRYWDQKGSAAVGLRESWQGHTLPPSIALSFRPPSFPPSLPGIYSFILLFIFLFLPSFSV